MKYIFILLLWGISLYSFGQIKFNFTGEPVLTNSNNSTIQYNKWYKTISQETITYIQLFNKNTIGIKKAVELSKEICANNNLDFDNPYKEGSYLASFVKAIEDFENLNLSISTGGSIIEKVWQKRNSSGKISIFRLILDEESYAIAITNPK